MEKAFRFLLITIWFLSRANDVEAEIEELTQGHKNQQKPGFLNPNQTLVQNGVLLPMAANGVNAPGEVKIKAEAYRFHTSSILSLNRMEHLQTQADSSRAQGEINAVPDSIHVKAEAGWGTSQRIKIKLLAGLVGSSSFNLAGFLIGRGIDDYFGNCEGIFLKNDQYFSEDDRCVGKFTLIGMSTGWVIGAPIAVSMLEPNDRFAYTLGGSLGGFVTCALLTLISDGTLWPSLLAGPLIFPLLASEWSRHKELSRKSLEAGDEERRIFISLSPRSGRDITAFVRLRF